MEQYTDSMLATRRRGHKSTATIASSRISQLFSNDVNTFQQETDTTTRNQSTKHLRRKAARLYRQKRGFSCKLPGVPSSWNNTRIASLRHGAEATSQLPPLHPLEFHNFSATMSTLFSKRLTLPCTINQQSISEGRQHVSIVKSVASAANYPECLHHGTILG